MMQPGQDKNSDETQNIEGPMPSEMLSWHMVDHLLIFRHQDPRLDRRCQEWKLPQRFLDETLDCCNRQRPRPVLRDGNYNPSADLCALKP